LIFLNLANKTLEFLSLRRIITASLAKNKNLNTLLPFNERRKRSTVIDPQSLDEIKASIRAQVAGDRPLLDGVRNDVKVLKPDVRRIQPRQTTSVSLVGTDGGNNQLQFDPFLVQLIRVVDSSNNELFLDVISPTIDVVKLSERQFKPDKSGGIPPLGRMMEFLGVKNLWELSSMIPKPSFTGPRSPSWVQVYRELVEWAVLFSLLRDVKFGTDTIIVGDGWLRSKVFAKDGFARLIHGMNEAIQAHYVKSRRRIYLAGVYKSSKVLDRYRLAMALEGILTTDYPAYLPIPRKLEENTFVWKESARDDESAEAGGEANKFVGGSLYFVKFGNRPRDPIWPVDIFLPQVKDAQIVLGCLLADAENGFPVPFYPQCLQRAHENAALVDFDFDIFQDEIFAGIREVLGEHAYELDVFRLRDRDPAAARYS
jgi:hypothetical protein